MLKTLIKPTILTTPMIDHADGVDNADDADHSVHADLADHFDLMTLMLISNLLSFILVCSFRM